jgi:predicted DsbA family dithiol-disulfide isomerase
VLADQAGITGVPYFVIDGKVGLSGGQPAEVFLRAFTQASALIPA